MFDIAMHDTFVAEMNRAPQKVQKAVRRDLALLRNHPQLPDPPKIKRLTGYRRLWRLRVSDSYRLVYRVQQKGSSGTVTLLMLGDRKDVYDRLGANDDGSPGISIITDDVNGLIERDPTPAELLASFETTEPEPDPDPDRDLPMRLDAEQLTAWGVAPKHHRLLSSAATEGQLLELSDRVPPKVLEHVLECMWPPDIRHIVNTPERIVDDLDKVTSAPTDELRLESFLLKLDDEQKAFVQRFRTDNPQGPWLLKGGPGSGKSVVALYCIRELIEQESQKLPDQRRNLRILLTTYTNSLVNASQHLLRAIGALDPNHQVTIAKIDQVVKHHLPSSMRGLNPIGERDARSYASKAIRAIQKRDSTFSFSLKDTAYLMEEVDWVIVGQDLRTLDQYLHDAERSGRRRGLNPNQRRQVWEFYEEVIRRMREDRKCLFTERHQAAIDNAEASFDFVFIDEAQDLRPVAVRFVTALVEPRTNVFLTADSNQSIYATGMAWSRVASDLNVIGRAKILRRNYRTTREIWDAVRQLAPTATDAETMDVEPVYHGTPPVFVRHSSMDRLGGRLNRFIFESMRAERVGSDSVAILCPTERVMRRVATLLDPRLHAQVMVSSGFRIDYHGVTITTMHASKGLGFPIVAIVGADEGTLPWPAAAGTDPAGHEERQHRLLFVAGTRAMKRLLLAADARRPSPFVKSVTDDYWQMEDV